MWRESNDFSVSFFFFFFNELYKLYNQVSTPLLRNVQFNYPQTSVTDVTQNSFPNYFGGSEIVVAGKVDPEKLGQLQSIITATSVLLL